MTFKFGSNTLHFKLRTVLSRAGVKSATKEELSLAASLELPQATNRDVKKSSPAALSSIDSVLTMVSKQSVAFPTAPKMTILMLTPILGPFGGDQLIVALNAGHPESGTEIGFIVVGTSMFSIPRE